MNGRWRVERRGAVRSGRPWLVLRGAEREAVLWNGSVLELVGARGAPRVGPDILGKPPDYETMLTRLRATPPEREIGEALLDQRLVSGIGNIWRAEALWEAQISPWLRLDQIDDRELRALLEVSHRLMQAAVEGSRAPLRVYRRPGRACPRCGGIVRSAPQGEHARTVYWCPSCQVGGNAPPS
jgi:endonuclease-8